MNNAFHFENLKRSFGLGTIFFSNKLDSNRLNVPQRVSRLDKFDLPLIGLSVIETTTTYKTKQNMVGLYSYMFDDEKHVKKEFKEYSNIFLIFLCWILIWKRWKIQNKNFLKTINFNSLENIFCKKVIKSKFSCSMQITFANEQLVITQHYKMCWHQRTFLDNFYTCFL